MLMQQLPCMLVQLASNPYKLATSLNAITIGRLKYCPRTV